VYHGDVDNEAQEMELEGRTGKGRVEKTMEGRGHALQLSRGWAWPPTYKINLVRHFYNFEVLVRYFDEPRVRIVVLNDARQVQEMIC
jgi:hypothetical protein